MIFRGELCEAVLEGRKTVTRRLRHFDYSDGKTGHDAEVPCRYRRGRTYAVQPGRGKPGIARIRVVSVQPEYMHQLTEEEAAREGFMSLKDFKRTWLDIYGRGSYLDPVWRIEFELVEEGSS